jgi:hypothetical protein
VSPPAGPLATALLTLELPARFESVALMPFGLHSCEDLSVRKYTGHPAPEAACESGALEVLV